MTALAKTALALAIVVCVPAIFVVTGLRVVADDTVVRLEYGRPGFPRDRFGLTKQERTQLGLAGLHAIQPSHPEGVDLLRAARLPSGKPAFRDRDLKHMADVRKQFGRALRYQLFAVGAIAALAVLLAFSGSSRLLVPRALRAGSLLTLGLAALVAVLVLTRPDAFFTPFHRVFFTGDSWRFDDADTLRRIYPDVFWRDVAIAVGAIAVVQALAVLVAIRIWTRSVEGARPARARAAAQRS